MGAKLEEKYLERMKKLLEVAKSIPLPEVAFDMTTFCAFGFGEGPKDLKEPKCGFRACLAGWYYTLVPESREELLSDDAYWVSRTRENKVYPIDFESAGKYFGLSRSGATYLFDPAAYVELGEDEDYDDIFPEDYPRIEVTQVIERVQDFLVNMHEPEYQVYLKEPAKTPLAPVEPGPIS